MRLPASFSLLLAVLVLPAAAQAGVSFTSTPYPLPPFGNPMSREASGSPPVPLAGVCEVPVCAKQRGHVFVEVAQKVQIT